MSLHQHWPYFAAELAHLYLRGISPAVINDFQEAMTGWKAAHGRTTPEDFAEKFRATAALLTDPDSVVDELSARPTRPLAADALITAG